MEVPTAETPLLAVDLGGTKIATALVTHSGQILDQHYTATLADEGPEAVVRRVIATIRTALSDANLDRPAFSTIALASAGIIDVRRGIVTASPSFPGGSEVPIR